MQISAGETGFDENVLDRVQAVPEVRVAVPVIEAVVSTGVQGQGNLLILGVDMTGDRSLRDYDLESSDQAERRGHRRSAGVPGAARFADGDRHLRARESLGDRQPRFR